MYGLCDALAAKGVVFNASTIQNFRKRNSLDRRSRRARLARQRRRERGAQQTAQ